MSDDSGSFALNVTPLLRQSAAERVVNQLIEQVRSGNLKAGDRLPTEAEIARAFHVSRPVVREALRSLAILGIVETRQGGRCFVTDLTVARLMMPLKFVISLDEANVESLHDARVLIETGMIARAATQVTEKDLARLADMVQAGLELTGDPLGFRLLDQEFHRTINQLGGNPFLEVVAQSLYELGMEYRRAATETPGVIERSAAEHQAIFEALRTREPDGAAAAMRAHLMSIHATTLDAIRKASRPGRQRSRKK